MPNVTTSHPDSYVCTSATVQDAKASVVGFDALASMKTAHHILVYKCRESGGDLLGGSKGREENRFK